MEEKRSKSDYEKADSILQDIIRRNLKILLESRGLSQMQFCNQLSEEKVSISRPYFSQILSGKKNNISITFLLSCCDFFGITLHNLVSENFNAQEYIYNDTATHQEYLDIAALLKKYEENKKTMLKKELKTKELLLPFSGTNLITDPNSVHFSGYMQDYYCYYYPTDSSENKKPKNILKGILNLKAEHDYCKATLTINTNTINDEGDVNYKKYTGYAAISPTVNSMNCIMYSDYLCEFCFLMFRFFKLNFGKQDCRIAGVLSSSSANEERRPAVLRMLLSKEEISEEDLKIVAPSMFLNYSTITINDTSLHQIANISETYQKIVDELLQKIPPQNIYFYKEKDIINLAQKYLAKKEEALEFVMQLRAASHAYRYNKVSTKADENVRNILLSKGYYKHATPQQKEKELSN